MKISQNIHLLVLQSGNFKDHIRHCAETHSWYLDRSCNRLYYASSQESTLQCMRPVGQALTDPILHEVIGQTLDRKIWEIIEIGKTRISFYPHA